jgi:hypothetical protein
MEAVKKLSQLSLCNCKLQAEVPVVIGMITAVYRPTLLISQNFNLFHVAKLTRRFLTVRICRQMWRRKILYQ